METNFRTRRKLKEGDPQTQILPPQKILLMLLFLDTETTGLPKYNATDPTEKWPRVVQLAWSLYDADGNRDS